MIKNEDEIKNAAKKLLEEYVKDASGSVDNPLTKEQVESKAIALMKEVCGEKAKTIAEEILKIMNLECMPEI